MVGLKTLFCGVGYVGYLIGDLAELVLNRSFVTDKNNVRHSDNR